MRYKLVVIMAGVGFWSPAALGRFLNIDFREDKTLSAAASALLPAGARTFNLYAIFDGGVEDDIRNTVLATGNDFTFFEINKFFGVHTDAEFFNTEAPFGGDRAPNSGFFEFDPTLEFDTFVTIGVKDSAIEDTTVLDPSFGMVDGNGDGHIDRITGGWANGNPPNLQGAPVFNAETGEWETVLAQLTIVGLDANADLGQRGAFGSPLSQGWHGEIFSGQLDLFRRGDSSLGEDPAVGFTMLMTTPPAPGTGALFGVAAAGMSRRRRIAVG